MKLIAFAAACGLGLAGCANYTPVAVPTDITLDQAMRSVGQGFAALEAGIEDAGIEEIGVYACTVDVTFNVTAGATGSEELVLSAGVSPPQIPISLSGTATQEATQRSAIGNTIAIRLASIGCMSEETIWGRITPEGSSEVVPILPPTRRYDGTPTHPRVFSIQR